jgi:broad specificity phosphatase PhoE
MGQRIDAALDDKGLEQAHEVIAKLPRDFAMIYSSPLKRAAQTAKIIADYFDKNIIIDHDLKERDFGTLSGMTWDEIDKEAGQKLSAQDEALTYDYTAYDGESAKQVKDRLVRFLDRIKWKHGHDTLVVVTHFGLISLMNSMYPHKEQHKLNNTSVHKFVI